MHSGLPVALIGECKFKLSVLRMNLLILIIFVTLHYYSLEVPVESSKSRRNANINPFIDKVLASKRADGLARLWEDHEEVFIYEQTGSPNFDDVTEFHVHDYKLVRTMRDVLNQRIILRLKSGLYDHKELASFGAFGHQTEVSLYWCTIHQRVYCIREYGSFKVPIIWQSLSVLSEAIITCLKFFVSITKRISTLLPFLLILTYVQLFMKKNIQKKKLCIEQNEQKNKLLAKRRVHDLKQNPSTPNRPKKQKK